MQHVLMFLYCHWDIYSCIATVYILGVSLLLNIFIYKSCSISLYSFAKLGSFQLLRILQQIQLFMVLPVSQFLVLIKCYSVPAAATLGPYQISQILGTCLFSMQQRAQGSGREAQLAELATARVSRAAALGNLL